MHLAWKAFFMVLPLQLLHLSSFTQSEDPLRIKDKAFQAGERLSYKVKYRLAGIWTKVGRVDFTVSRDTCPNHHPCYEFQAKGWTLSFYDRIFKVRDIYRSHATWDDIESIHFSRNVREGGNIYSEYYRFDHEKKMVYRKGSRSQKVDSIPLPPNALDVLTAVYRCRSMDLEPLSKNDSVHIDLVLGDDPQSTHFIYRGKKPCEGPNGSSLTCHYIEPELIKGSIFKEGDRMKVLVTDDARKIPVYVETEIIVGRVKVKLVGMEGSIDP